MPLQVGNTDLQRAVPTRNLGTPRAPSSAPAVTPTSTRSPQEPSPLEQVFGGGGAQVQPPVDLIKLLQQAAAAPEMNPLSRFTNPNTPDAAPASPAAPSRPGAAAAILDAVLHPGREVRQTFDPTAVRDTQADWLQALNGNDYQKQLNDWLTTGGRTTGPDKPAGDVSSTRAAYDEALRGQRAQAIGANTIVPDRPGSINSRLDKMTQEEYDALSPKQRAAVDFNTMLVDAVRTDLHHQDDYHATPEQQGIYDESVQNMFGKDRGSDLYAPATMAVLKQIGYTDTNADLDDFLGLKATIKSGELDNLVPQTPGAPVNAQVAENANPVRNDRLNLAVTLTNDTQQMIEQKLMRGNQLLGSVNVLQGAMAERNQDLFHMGGLEPNVPATLGYGTDEVSQYFQQAFDTLATPENQANKDKILASINTDLSPSEFNAFMAYADNRSMMSQRYKMPLGQNPDEKLLRPEQFRKMLGLDEINDKLSTTEAPATQEPAQRQTPGQRTPPPVQQGSGY